MDYKKIFIHHKKKFLYILVTLFILNLGLLISNRGVLIGEECWMKDKKIWPDDKYHNVSCSLMRKQSPIYVLVDCKYWMGRGTFTISTGKEYCNFTKRIDEF